MFDSGCESTIVIQQVTKGILKKKGEEVRWKTKAGTFTTNEVCELEMKFPAFDKYKEVIWKVYVEPERNEQSKYDIRVGRDMMLKLGINLMFSEERIAWGSNSITMQHPSMLEEPEWEEILEQEILYIHDPLTTETDRIQTILDAKYKKADLKKEIEKCLDLTKEEKERLENLLKKYEELFNGTLGSWNTEPVELELKEEGTKPVQMRPYPVPQSHERKLREEINRLCELGVLRKVNRSEWSSLMFTIPKPDGTLRSLADFRELNKKLKENHTIYQRYLKCCTS